MRSQDLIKTEYSEQIEALKTQLSELSASASMVAPTSSGDGGGSGALKISYFSFATGDIALFFPTQEGRMYLAFNDYSVPIHYLSEASLREFRMGNPRHINRYILGRIVFLEECIASEERQPPGILPSHIHAHAHAIFDYILLLKWC